MTDLAIFFNVYVPALGYLIGTLWICGTAVGVVVCTG